MRARRATGKATRLELIGTKKSDEPLELEMDQSKRNYLHPKEGTDAAKIGAGLFINKL